ncbi:MAG: glycosyltransferase [Synergistaceae bacterium]|jgi:GT2 family glycosyltransferase|nr:glycosyltransferase [Synergistaceae bacterium]
MISVIIATRNRNAAIAEISLPSLLRQDCSDFEVIIWDASDDESTRDVSCKLGPHFKDRRVDLIYQKASRVGIASQRNDAVRKAKGDVIFFIDDDAEVSSDGLGAIKRYFDDFAWLKGMGLPILDVHSRFDRYVTHPFFGAFRDFVFRFFMSKPPRYRKIMNSTRNILPIPDSPGIAEWLNGGCMAYRKSVFDDLSLDEGLERFGGYAVGEDYDFSHRIWLRYGKPLLISASGFVVHHNAQTARMLKGPDKVAAIYYNTARIRNNFRAYRPYKLLPFLWELRMGLTLSLLRQGMSPLDLTRGYLRYKRARRKDLARLKDKKS